MNATVREWVGKSELDLATAGRELHAPDPKNFDAVCFHAQQSVEKLMKAFLIHSNVMPPRTHDLQRLSEMLGEVHEGWNWPIEELRFLSRAAVDYRYPGESADTWEAAEAFQIAQRLRERLLSIF